jgi:hypothetical protein
VIQTTTHEHVGKVGRSAEHADELNPPILAA